MTDAESMTLTRVLHRALLGEPPSRQELSQLTYAENALLVTSLVRELELVKSKHLEYVTNNPYFAFKVEKP